METLDDGLIGTAEAAILAHRHQRTIVAWIRSGKLKAWKMPGGRGPYVIRKDALLALVQHLSTPAPYIPGGNVEQQQS